MSQSATSPGESVVVGVDFGTLSGRALVVRVADGEELGTATHEYQHAVMDRVLADGTQLPPEWALQDATDYVEVLRVAVPKALAEASVDPSAVVGIAVDFTACTLVATTEDGTPLSEVDGFEGEPHAYVKLWKHHAAQGQADRLNELAREREADWLHRYGGLVSSEWQFAKALQVLEEAPEVYAASVHLVEAADWIVWQLCGELTRNACTAGYKGLYQDGGYPGPDFLAALAPGFEDFVTDKLAGPIVQLGERVGSLSDQASELTGLPAGIAVAAGNVDAHVTIPAARAVDPGTMVVIMGTSTCHVVNSDVVREVPGMCGVVEGGITEGLWGYEAGQSGVGDIFNWFVTEQVPAAYHEEADAQGRSLHEHLTALASEQAVGEHGLLALDWHGGNRSILVDSELSGLVMGMTLATRPEDVYRALVEATAFGTRTIIEAFVDAGVAVDELVVAGGLLKNPMLMQIYADVTNRSLSVIGSAQGSALGSAIHAAVAAGAYPDVTAASEAMGRKETDRYTPIPANVEAYEELFQDYRTLHDYFGRGTNDVMHRLRARRRRAKEERK